MAIYSITFAPPHHGFEGEFNTLRLGRTLAQRLKQGDKIAITDSKTGEVIKWAEVTETHAARLPELLREHAHRNHKEHGLGDPAGAPQRRRESMTKIYGPRFVTDTRWATAVYMRIIESEFRIQVQPDHDEQA